MVKKSRGFRSGTRKKLKKRKKTGITKFLQKFKIGEKAMIVQEPSSHKGMPFPRFKGKVGKIIGSRGSSYILELKNGKKKKFIISRPEHLRKV